MDGSDVRVAARRVKNHPATSALARLGYAASGLLHLLLGVVAARVAWFHEPTAADQSGAFATLAREPLGGVALWVLTTGFAGLAVWQVTEAVGGANRTGERAKAVGKAVLYAALAWTGARFAQGEPTSADEQSRDFTATLMAQPGGRFAVGVVGLAVIGVAVYHVHKGWSRRFLRDLAKRPGRFVTGAARLGYIAKGIALGVVGGLFIAAAMHAQPHEAGGLDAALRTLGQQPFGTFLLTVIAVGLAAYGVYSFGRARWTRT